MKPGTVYVFPLRKNLFGACRVLRGPELSELAYYKSHVLVHATQWFGPSAPSLKEPSLRRVFSIFFESFESNTKRDAISAAD